MKVVGVSGSLRRGCVLVAPVVLGGSCPSPKYVSSALTYRKPTGKLGGGTLTHGVLVLSPSRPCADSDRGHGTQPLSGISLCTLCSS